MAIIGYINNKIQSSINHLNARLQYLNAIKDIDYSAGYDVNTEKMMRAAHDYAGCADYLEHFRPKDPTQQRDYRSQISELRTLDKRYKAMSSKADSSQADALNFKEAFDNGNIGMVINNIYKDRYLKDIDFLGRNVSSFDRFMIGFGNTRWSPNQSEDIKKQEQDAADEGVSPTTINVTFNNKHYGRKEDGFFGVNRNINTYTPNPVSQFIEALSGIKDWINSNNEDQFNKFCEDTGYTAGDIRQILGDGNIATPDGYTSLNIDKTNLKAVKLLRDIENWRRNSDRFSDDVTYASSYKGEVLSDNSELISKQIRYLDETFNLMDSELNKLNEKVTGGNKVMSTVTMPYVNEYQGYLYQLLSSGQIDGKTFNDKFKADNDIYDNLLLGNNFGNLDIYMRKDGNLVQLTDNVEKQGLHDYVALAISEGRARRMSGFSNGQYGYYLAIDPKGDEGKNPNDYDDDDSRRGTVLFFPGLFTETVQTAFNNSTEGKTMKAMDDMQTYQYDYDLTTGGKIEALGNDGAIYVTPDKERKTIGRDEAKRLINESITIEESAYMIEDEMYNLNGSQRANYDYKYQAKKIAAALISEQTGEVYQVDEIFNPDGTVKLNQPDSNVYRDDNIRHAGFVYTAIVSKIFKSLNNTR